MGLYTTQSQNEKKKARAEFEQMRRCHEANEIVVKAVRGAKFEKWIGSCLKKVFIDLDEVRKRRQGRRESKKSRLNEQGFRTCTLLITFALASHGSQSY